MFIHADCHVHSNTSMDAKDDIATICQAAIDRGLRQICLTNHFEIFPGSIHSAGYQFDFDHYSDEVERAKEKFGDRLEILKGVEFGQPHRYPKEFEAIVAKDFDMIIASVHTLPVDFCLQWLWGAREAFLKEAQPYFEERYFEEMQAMAAFGGFQVVGHFDWPKRVFPNFQGDVARYREIFTAMQKNREVLEINTSAYDRGCPCFYPTPEILSAYYESGHRRLVVGSDAHIGLDVGKHFEKAEDYIVDTPFETGYFQQQKFIADVGYANAERPAPIFSDFSGILQDQLWGGAIEDEYLKELAGVC